MLATLLMSLMLVGTASTLAVEDFTSLYLTAEAGLSLSASRTPAEDIVASQTVWKGKCSQSGYEPYPMIMYVRGRKGNEISGILHWPTLRNSKTKFKGKIKDDSVSFTEYELIQGSGIALPTLYEAKIVDDLISGTWTYADTRGTFHVQLVRE